MGSYYLATEGGTYYISQLYPLHSGTHWRVVLITQWYKSVQITQWYKVVHFTQWYTFPSVSLCYPVCTIASHSWGQTMEDLEACAKLRVAVKQGNLERVEEALKLAGVNPN